MPKRTYQPKVRRRKRRHGFRNRTASTTGKRVLTQRRRKKRARLTV